MKGVYKTKNGKWQAFFWPDGRAKYLGIFDSQILAQKAINDALILWRVENARKSQK